MLLRLRWKGLRSRIIAWAFVPTAIILAAVAFVTYQAYQQVTQDLVIERNAQLARLSAGQLSNGLTEYSDLLTSIARTSGMAQPGPRAQAAGLRGDRDRLVVFDGGAVILDNLGLVTAAEPPRPEIIGQDWSNRDYFRQMVRSPGPVFSSVLPDGPDGAEVVVVAVPITGARGETLGVLAGMFRLNTSSVSAFYGGIVRLRIGASRIYLVDKTGRIVYHTEAAQIGQDFSGVDAARRVIAGEAGSVRTRGTDGRAALAAYAPIPGTPWGLVTEESWSALMRSSEGYQGFLLFLLALGVLVPIVVLAVGMRRITRPIDQLIVAAQEVAGGKFGQRITAETGDEVAELAEQFNIMSAQLEASYAHLEQRVGDRTRELATLNAIAAVVSQSLDLDEVLQDALDKTIEVMRVESGAAFFVEETPRSDAQGVERWLVLRGQCGISSHLAHLVARVPAEDDPAAQAAFEGSPVVWQIADYGFAEVREALLAEGLQVAVSVPLMSKGRMMGLIDLGTSAQRTFTPEELTLLAGIGQQVGVALENAWLYEKAEEVAAAAERSRLARDLHDAVTQTLFSASLISEVLPKIWDRNPEEGHRRLEELRQLTRGALAEMRTLLLELRPSALMEAPLPDLLRQLCESTTGRGRLPVSLTVDGDGSLPVDVKLVVYRVAQEALNNVAKHSGASAAQVSLRFLAPSMVALVSDGGNGGSGAGKTAVELCIADNGHGFDPSTVPLDHLGLGIMRERAEAIGARLSIDSEPGQGTEVYLVWRSELACGTLETS